MQHQAIAAGHQDAHVQGRGHERTPRKPYRVAQVAAALDVHPSTIYRDIEAGRLRALRVGAGRGALRIPQAAFDEYLTLLESEAPIASAEVMAR